MLGRMEDGEKKPREPSPETVRRTKCWHALERVAARQLGVVAHWQAADLGLDGKTFVEHARRHGWERLTRGLWAAPWSEVSFARRCALERVRGSRARLLTGEAQLVLLGVRRDTTSLVDLWVGPGRSPRAQPGVRFHRGRWASGDAVARVQGIPSTPVLRALRDAARRSTVDRLVRDIAALDRMRRATPAQVAADLDRIGPFPGKPKLRAAVLESLDGLVHSGDEALARQLLAAESQQPHPRPLLVEHGCRRIGEIDIPYCWLRYGIEVDGPHHREDGVAERDRARDRALGRLDWVIDRVPAELVRTNPGAFVQAVRAGLAAAVARSPEPWPCDRCGTR